MTMFITRSVWVGKLAYIAHGLWEDCKSQIDGVSNAKFKKFFTLKEAEEFVNYWKNYAFVEEKSDPKISGCNLDSGNLECRSCILDKPINSLRSFEKVSVKNSESQEHQLCACNTSKKHILPSFVPVLSSTVNNEPTTVDFMSISLRLDSFEKRFDACLKEVGGILSNLNHFKDEIKDIKESIKFSALPSNLSKNKAEVLQTKLKFSGRNYDNENTFSVQYPSSSRFYSNSTDGDRNERDEPVIKKAKTSKKNLLTNDFVESINAIDVGSSEGLNFDERIKTVNFTSFKIDSENFVHVYTDGACQANGKKEAKAGIGVWFGDCHPLNISESVKGTQTNNSAEIQAARVAIELAIKAGVKKLKIFTDSEFLINCATKWIRRWKKNNWTLIDGGRVKNKSELEKLDRLASEIIVRWVKVEGHSGVKGNEMADKLAKEGIDKYQS